MQRIILGIHGLGNKPPADIQEKWWIRSIEEGLHKIGSGHLNYDFELVYWADILHPHPLDPAIPDKEDSRFLDEPYLPSPESTPIQKKV